MSEMMNFQVMIEEDKAEGDFIAYVPAVRLGARGETKEEALENAKDILMMALESRIKNGKGIPTDSASMEMIMVAVPH